MLMWGCSRLRCSMRFHEGHLYRFHTSRTATKTSDTQPSNQTNTLGILEDLWRSNDGGQTSCHVTRPGGGSGGSAAEERSRAGGEGQSGRILKKECKHANVASPPRFNTSSTTTTTTWWRSMFFTQKLLEATGEQLIHWTRIFQSRQR